MTTVADILKIMESWAPAATAQSYDNVGLLVGDANAKVSAIVIALDLTPAVIAEAADKKCELIITHHPPLFAAIKSIRSDDATGAMMHDLISNGISLIASHTNLDAARDGVSFELARVLGLTDIEFLNPLPDTLVKLVTFVPLSDLPTVQSALADAGAGRIGNYDSCSFAVDGRGYFRPLSGANPSSGTVGNLHEEPETRLEVEVESWNLGRILSALKSAHPYEEVAYDIYPVKQSSTRYGMGAIGHLASPESLSSFLTSVGKALNTPAVRFTGDLESIVETVAVCGGSGSSLIGTALSNGADAYVTGDITYHKFFDVLDPAGQPMMAVIDPGHYETEAMTEALICRYLDAHVDGVKLHPTRMRTSPIEVHVTDPDPK